MSRRLGHLGGIRPVNIKRNERQGSTLSGRKSKLFVIVINHLQYEEKLNILSRHNLKGRNYRHFGSLSDAMTILPIGGFWFMKGLNSGLVETFILPALLCINLESPIVEASGPHESSTLLRTRRLIWTSIF